jgi:ATP-dependent helicase/DNAse subunit B
LDQPALEARVGAHVDTVLNRYQQQHPAALDGMMRSLERHNLSTKVLQWLDIEKNRPAVSVTQREEKSTLTIGPLKLTGQPDRVDQLASGERIIVDYKSGKTSKTDWQPGERLTDGQLPAYALNLNPPAQGIAFGKLAKDQINFDGLAAHDLDINGIKPIDKYNYGSFKTLETWPDLLDAWRDELAKLAEEYQQGHAPVAPVSDKVCRNCHLKSVCRIGQRSTWSDHTSDAQEVSNE